MKRKWLKLALVSAIGLCLIRLAGCARDQQLVSITVIPNTETFGPANIPVAADAGLSVRLRPLGNYIHPPVTKEITHAATRRSNHAQMVTVPPGSLLASAG